MKIDRLVKVMLVLIVVLLALNCAKTFSNSSDSRGNSNSSAGSSGTPIFERIVEAAPPSKTQYKVVEIMGANASRQLQQVLDQQSEQGWEYAGSVATLLILKK